MYNVVLYLKITDKNSLCLKQTTEHIQTGSAA